MPPSPSQTLVGSDGFESIGRALNVAPLRPRNTVLDRTRLPLRHTNVILVGAPGFEPVHLKRELVLRTSAANRIRLTPRFKLSNNSGG
jgi:hypothetical protein